MACATTPVRHHAISEPSLPSPHATLLLLSHSPPFHCTQKSAPFSSTTGLLSLATPSTTISPTSYPSQPPLSLPSSITHDPNQPSPLPLPLPHLPSSLSLLFSLQQPAANHHLQLTTQFPLQLCPCSSPFFSRHHLTPATTTLFFLTCDQAPTLLLPSPLPYCSNLHPLIATSSILLLALPCS
ncbi:hypothetical protein AMTR_s00028p00184290 [Amborella trichopoda]|uniref:Uncharacterized protein n=1 Tax=Amborella trichopoda TaxID=13333 RepID=W1PTK7_AMBTC|nr:hypothetical protein AMTR_s00028p00184290 [Amborella trichopoda]